jgi:hypothetical protein
MEGWKMVEGMARRRKKKNVEANKTRIQEDNAKSPTRKNSRWGQKSHQSMNNNNTPYSNGNPPPAFATTSTETIDFSIGFGFAALIYISLEMFREFYVDFVDIRREIRVFTRFCLPHHAKCRPNITNSTPHAPKPLGRRTKLLWTLLMVEKVFPLMEEMKEPVEMMITPL